MSIRFEDVEGKTLCEVREVGAHGLPGLGSYTLVLRVELIFYPPKIETLINNLAIRVDSGDGKQRMIGYAFPDQSLPIRITEFTNSLQLEFRIILSPSQLDAIEDYRNGGDLEFFVWFSGVLLQNSRTSTIQNGEKYTINQQTWLDALSKMEYQQTILHEVGISQYENNKDIRELINKSHKYILLGDYDQCVAMCRKLLEIYEISTESKGKLKIARHKYKGNRSERESMDIYERLLILRDSLSHLIHLSHHNHDFGHYSREQAKSILNFAISIISLRL